MLAAEELATLFKPQGHQSDINDYFSGGTEVERKIEILRSNNLVTAQESLALPEDNIKSEKKRKSLEQYQTTLF